jgi:nicotinamidase-related amidase
MSTRRAKEQHPVTTPTAPSIDPARSALLLMDFQPAILAAVPDGEQALERAHDALAWARKHNVQVAHVRVALAEGDRATIPAQNKTFAAAAAQGWLNDGLPHAETHESLTAATHENDILVRKVRISAFASDTDLRALLREKDIDTLILAGLSTSGVVLTTLRQAADDDFRLFVLHDATADPDADVHQVLTEKVFPQQAEVIATEDLHTLTQVA